MFSQLRPYRSEGPRIVWRPAVASIAIVLSRSWWYLY